MVYTFEKVVYTVDIEYGLAFGVLEFYSSEENFRGVFVKVLTEVVVDKNVSS